MRRAPSGRRRLVETAEVRLLVRRLGTDVDFQNELALWSQVSVPELSVVLVHLEFTARVHKNHHWQAKADPFYGDHLLFDRLAIDVAKFVDRVAEKAIGMGGPENLGRASAILQKRSPVVGTSAALSADRDRDRARKYAERRQRREKRRDDGQDHGDED